ncbi:MAG: hypothetical protein V4787_24380 [Pseudomonadota bacterium]
MEKGIECGVRFTKNVLLLGDNEFEARLNAILPQVDQAMRAQRQQQKRVEAVFTAKGEGDSAFAAKTVELYCRSKEAAEIVDPLSKGIECGIRIKQYVLDMSDKVFGVYMDDCLSAYRTSIMEQRRMFVQSESQKSVQLEDAMKGIELYCGTKNFCG